MAEIQADGSDIIWRTNGRHVEGGGDYIALRNCDFIGYLCVTYNADGQARARLHIHGTDARPNRDEELPLDTIDHMTEAQARRWAEKLMHRCTAVCFAGIASEHVTRFGFMPRLEDLT